MAALLIAMSITALLMTAAMPVWKQMVQRDKEEELIFRGRQYVHAITLYGRKFANTQPPSIDVLVNQKFLRKKYKDPITNDDFQIVLATGAAPAGRGGGTGTSTANPSSGGATGGTTSPAPQATPTPRAQGGSTTTGRIGTGPAGGIIGVNSKSKEKSIKLFNGRSHYNEWVFTYQPSQQTPGGGGGAAVPGGVTTPGGGITPRPPGGGITPRPAGGGQDPNRPPTSGRPPGGFGPPPTTPRGRGGH
jgi:type II secretory pathway pseudopilin PulG